MKRFTAVSLSACLLGVAISGCSVKTEHTEKPVQNAASTAPQQTAPNLQAAPPSLQATNQVPASQQTAAIGADENITFWSNYPPDVLSAALVARMTDEELLSQILMFGWAGAEPSREILRWVEERHIGSVKIFGWNTDDTTQLARSVAALQRAAQNSRFKIPLFVATDQEGGWIRHVKGKTSETPGNLAIGASGLPYDAYMTGLYIALELRTLGINMNFAPTVDLYTDINSTVIGPRSFGEDPEAAGILAAAFCKGHLEYGVIPTAKHFPGHGDTGNDSHGVLPVIEANLETLTARELIPFERLIRENIPAIMTGHLSFPNITAAQEPASLSSFFIKNILRQEMHFNGLVITDDMMMNGATAATGSLSRAVQKAVQAGNDIILSSATPFLQDPLWTRNLQLMKRDPEFRAAVATAAGRVIKTKLRYLQGEKAVPLYPDAKAAEEYLPAPGARDFFLEQACRSITVLKDSCLPVVPEKTPDILIAGQFATFIQAGEARYPHAKKLLLPYSLGPNGTAYYTEQLVRMAKSSGTVIFCVATKESRQIFESLKASGKQVIAVSVLAPVFLQETGWADALLAAYSYAPESFTAAFAVIAGDFTAGGKMPLSALTTGDGS